MFGEAAVYRTLEYADIVRTKPGIFRSQLQEELLTVFGVVSFELDIPEGALVIRYLPQHTAEQMLAHKLRQIAIPSTLDW